MGATLVGDVSNQVQKFWSPLFQDELLERNLLANLVNKDYEGDLKKAGDTVYVSQINRPTATRKTVGSGHEYFNTNKLSTSRVTITADQVISASFEFDDLVELQSQIGDQDSKIRQALVEAIGIELNNYLYEKVSPSTSSPDHFIDSVTDFNASQLNTVRKLASQANWAQAGGWYGLLDPQYYSDLLNAATLTSVDNVDERPIVGGMFGTRRFGFNLFEDNSAGLISAMQRLDGSSTATEDAGLFFHPDFMIMVMQQGIEFKVAELTANKQFGYVIVAKMVVGAALGNDGADKHIVVYNT
jgi:hypothetical protein